MQMRAKTCFALWTSLSACGKPKSDGLVTDYNICNTSAATAAQDVAQMEALLNGHESPFDIPGSPDGKTTVVQSFTPAVSQVIWGLAIKVQGPKGADAGFTVSLHSKNPISGIDSLSTLQKKAVSSEDIGIDPTWLLIDFPTTTELEPATTYWLATTPGYTPAALQPVQWFAGPGSGLWVNGDVYDSSGASWQALDKKGTFLLEACK